MAQDLYPIKLVSWLTMNASKFLTGNHKVDMPKMSTATRKNE